MSPDNNPRSLAGASFEFKGMFFYHICMMIMMVVGTGLTFIEQIFIAAAIALSVATASFIRRLRRKWRWRGVSVLRATGAIGTAALMGYFLFATSSGALLASDFAIDRPFGIGPWILAGLGIAVFAVLDALNVVHGTERAFRMDCGEEAAEQPEPEVAPEPRWKRVISYAFAVAFLAVWLEGVTFFYVHDRTLRASSPTPTFERSAALENKGRTVYVTTAEKRLVDQLETFMVIGIPAAIATGFFLQFVLKIRS